MTNKETVKKTNLHFKIKVTIKKYHVIRILIQRVFKVIAKKNLVAQIQILKIVTLMELAKKLRVKASTKLKLLLQVFQTKTIWKYIAFMEQDNAKLAKT